MRQSAKRSNPKLWAQCKREACTRGRMCKHSARKMQWAVRCYKSKGGKYIGNKSSRNSLRRWTEQNWRTFDGSKSEGKKRYIPEKAWKNLSKDQIQRTNDAKLKGFRKGKQFVKQPKDIASITKLFR